MKQKSRERQIAWYQGNTAHVNCKPIRSLTWFFFVVWSVVTHFDTFKFYILYWEKNILLFIFTCNSTRGLLFFFSTVWFTLPNWKFGRSFVYWLSILAKSISGCKHHIIAPTVCIHCRLLSWWRWAKIQHSPSWSLPQWCVRGFPLPSLLLLPFLLSVDSSGCTCVDEMIVPTRFDMGIKYLSDLLPCLPL